MGPAKELGSCDLAAASLVLCALFASPAGAAPLGSASLQIAGTRLTVSPASQTVPFDVPTLVETHLEGYDAANGVLPQDLRVRGDFTGPEVDGVLVLETVPNEPFQVPRLRLEGDYRLENIRLVQGETLLAYAEPRSAAVLVTQVLVTSVRSRPLTLDEIRHFGLVIDDDSFTAMNLTFGFGVDSSNVIEYNMPLIYRHYGPEGRWESPLASVPLPQSGEGTAPPSSRFIPPQLIPFELELEYDEPPEIPYGGCPPEDGECRTLFPPGPPLVGVILFPTDISLLHQFFSVVLMVQNGAPDADPLVLRDVVARISVPQGLRQAATEPPTPLGVPVPVRVPGPDGELGTGDDLNFLVAQATGDAEFLVEGMKEGTHVVELDIAGIVEGLPGGSIQRVTGRARGAVIVRDPTLSVTISHPHTVRAFQEYSLFLTVSNNGNAPVNLLSLKLPVSGLSGVQLAAGEVHEKTIPQLLPGDSEVVEFELVSTLTGKVVASSVKSGSAISPNFEWSVAVGADIPLSPNTLNLPESANLLPEELVRAGLGLVGLGHSAATAPRSQLSVGSIRVGKEVVNERIYRFAQAGRHVKLGEELFEATALLAAELSGARDFDWEWDRLRRETRKGGQMAAAFAAVMSAEETDPATAFDRFARATRFLHPQAVMAEGSGAVLEVMSRTSGKAIFGTAADPDDPQRARELPFAELYGLGAAELVTLTLPEENGYRALVRHPSGGSAELHLLVPDAAGTLRVVRFAAVSLNPSDVAFVDFDAADTSFELKIDAFGDGIVDGSQSGAVTTLAPRPFEALAAVQNATADPSGHVLDVLMSNDVDLRSLLPRDPARFTIPGKVSNGGLIEMELDADGGLLGQAAAENPLAGLQNTRILRVVFDNPLSPLAGIDHRLTIRDLMGVGGEELVQQTLAVETTVTQPGIQVEGKVIGPDGQPVPFAEVALFEYDPIGTPPNDLCVEHRTAAVVADGAGRFHFDYVRQTECGDVFRVAARDLIDPKWGEARGRVRLVGSTQTVDVIMIGRGTVRGRVTYEDGTVPPGVRVIAHNPVFDEGRLASVDADGNYLANDVMVGTVTLAAHDPEGRIVYQTIEIPQAGSVVERDLVILRLDSSPPPTGEVRGTVYELDGTAPEYNAHVALYVDGQLIASERSGVDGTFDFGIVPAGIAELEAFDGVTGRAGAQHFFTIEEDEVAVVDLYLRDDRGTVQGHVYRQQIDGTVSPVPGAVVWAAGTPFNTTTDGDGFYVLDDVFAGNWSIQAADLDTGKTVSATATIPSTGGAVDRDLYFFAELPSGGITGEVLDYDGNPVDGARVHLAGDYYSVRWHHEVHTNELGRFAIPDVGPGIYGVHAISGAADGGVGFANVRFPGDTPFVTVRFRKGTIKGQTLLSDGETGVLSTLVYRTTRVVPQWDIVVLDKDFTTVQTDDEGDFQFDDILIGPYEIYVYNQFHTKKSVESALEVHGQVNEHTFVFEDNGAIHGVVYDVDGETPMPDVEVSLEGGSFAPGGYVVTTDGEGRFTFELVPVGSYAIKAFWEGGVIFRRQQVSVFMSRAGDEIEVGITLPAQGSVIGLVQDADGLDVEGAVVTLSERGYPFRVMVSNADEDGNFQFDNVFAGEISLRAQAPALGSIGGKSTVEIDFEGHEVFAVLTLEAVGEVVGTVLNPETGDPVPNAKASLYRASFFDSITTDENGEFRFVQLPLGNYQVGVFDPTTGRRGKSAWVEVESNGHVAHAGVTLEARGEVDGNFYDGTEASPIPGATVRLDSRGLKWFTTYSSTGEAGYFEFLGIPEGDFHLSAVGPTRRRLARASGTILEEDERVNVDLVLEPFAGVAGQIRTPDGSQLFENVNVRLVQGSPFSSFDAILGATTDNPFAFDGLLPGDHFTIYADEIGGLHRTVYHGTAGEPGSTLEVEIEMPAIGSATVTVVDSFDQPVSGADVRVSNRHELGTSSFDGSTGSDHEIHFDDLREGSLTAVATHPHNGLRGSASAVLADEGEDVEIEVMLQPSGFVRGRAVLSDGLTAAAGASVSLNAGGKQYLSETGENGEFEFEAIALVGWTLIVQESFGPGTITRSGSLAANGEIDDLGDLILDGEDPYVVSISPPSGARDLLPGTQVVVELNEPIDVARLPSDWFQVRKLGTGAVAALTNPSWSDGDRRFTATPQLASGTGYEIRITTGVIDLAGRNMSWLVRSTFTTADVVPPNVIDILPRNGQVQVPVDAVILITFSEPILVASLSGDALELHDLTDGRQLATTYQLRANEREVVLTPVDPVFADRQMQVRVKNAVDKAGNVMQGEVVTTFRTPDETAPEIAWTAPEEGAVFTSGDSIPAAVTASDNRGMDRVVYTVGDWTFTSSTEPFSHTLLAPVVSVPTDLVITATAVDVYGNQTSVDRTLRVDPHVNGEPPAVEPGCWADGDYVAAGYEIPLAYSITDDESIESYALVVDGERLEAITPVAAPTASGTFTWRPPQSTAPGTVFAVRVEARDFAGNVGFFEAAMKVPDEVTEVLLKSDQIVNPANYAGQDLFLAHGVFTFNGSPQLGGLRLMRGAVVRKSFGGPLAPVVDGTVTLQDGSRIEVADVDLTATGTVTVRCGTRIDVTGGGYAGGTGGQPAEAPEWVAPAFSASGGSHGGVGTDHVNNAYPGPPGEIYDSVYRPQLGGGGAAVVSGTGASGGGVLSIAAPDVVLDGELLALGAPTAVNFGPYGGAAGGAVSIDAASLSGEGRIDASGGKPCCGSGTAGGGRVALDVGDLSGFDALRQVSAYGSGHASGPEFDGPPWGGAGTIYIRDAGATYGELILDAGRTPSGKERFGPPVELPALGAGDLLTFTSAGSDAEVSAEEPFRPRWLGAWMALTDVTGADLGAFEVTGLTPEGHAVLAGAGAVAGAAGYRGEYFFDRIRLRSVDFDASDPVHSPEIELGGTGSVLAAMEIVDLTLIEGGRMRPQSGSEIYLMASGTVTVEPGAVIDVTGFGYPGGAPPAGPGQAPPWVTASGFDAGGSHGGEGTLGRADGGPIGDVYDSVYLPRLGGGGGAANNGFTAAAGGGVIEIEAQELVLEGELRARGGFGSYTNPNSVAIGAGGGGSVLVDVGVLRGAGRIDVAGGDSNATPCCGNSGRGGGGRAAIYAGQLNGFDPLTQVEAHGGEAFLGNPTPPAAPGTIFVFHGSSVYGDLIVDAGDTSAGGQYQIQPTRLPGLGTGAVAGLEVAGADAWIEPAGGVFRPRWLGAWIELQDAAATELGRFRVLEIDGQGRVLAEGAGVASSAATYRGRYLFDQVELLGDAGIQAEDPVDAGATVLEGEVQVAGEIVAESVVVRSGARVTPAAGSSGLKFLVSGTMTVEADAVVDVTGFGYPGGPPPSGPGEAPPWVIASGFDAGGSHGGSGTLGNASGGPIGDIYDSVYLPRLGGGGGSIQVHVGVLRGTGVIDASGGDGVSGGAGPGGRGGGGRVAIYATELSDFDPLTQAVVHGGESSGSNPSPPAGPGTIFVFHGGSTYGELIVDAGDTAYASNGVVWSIPVTRLPTLGNGAVTALTVSGADAWVEAPEVFLPRWLGAWMELRTAAGESLGWFEVVDLVDGKVLAAGAGNVSGAVSYVGEYRFDAIRMAGDAGLAADDQVAGGVVEVEDLSRLPGRMIADSVRILTGGRLRPSSSDGILELSISGELTVEAGAAIDLTGYGYPGGVPGQPGGVPENVEPSYTDAGGSHGGRGRARLHPGPAGEEFDSVYFPRLAGGGGAPRDHQGAPGGGALLVTAAQVTIDGEILARGAVGSHPIPFSSIVRGAGGGGTVSIETGILRGAGAIDVSGGNSEDSGAGPSGAGGGGRARICAGQLDGFDPDLQVTAYGGHESNQTSVAAAAPGTIYLCGGTYGQLVIDAGGRTAPLAIVLPTIDRGVVGAIEVDGGDADDLWIEPLDTEVRFDLGVAGMWVRIGGIDYRVVDQSADRGRLLLDGAAGAVGVGDGYHGVYKFDTVMVRGGASLHIGDFDEVTTYEVESGSAVVRADFVPPVISDVLPASGSTVTAGSTFTASATVSDDTAVAEVRFLFDGSTVVDSTAPYQAGFLAPGVSGDVALTVEAVDSNGNLATASNTLQVDLLPPGDPPYLEILCPSSAGALLAPGTGLDIAIDASSPEGIDRVEVYLDGAAEPDQVLFAPPWDYRLEAPLTAVDGDVLAVRVVTRNYAGLAAEATFDVRIVEGWVITGDALLAAEDAAFEGMPVVVAGGTLTIEGAHDFRDLAILDGALVTHPPTTSTETHRLDLALTGGLYVACGGAIDVAGRGYPGAYSYPGTTAEGAPAGVGGSHGGRGGYFAESLGPGLPLPGRIYGSLFDPADPGAGSGGGGATAGGGVIRVAAAGEIVIDGALFAAGGGQGSAVPHGAGGSVRLDAMAIRGHGTVDASGSGSSAAEPGGGGGRVALYGGTIDDELLARTFAGGGDSSTAAARGAAGTVFVQRCGQAFGELIVDNGTVASTQLTELLAVGSGAVDAVDTDGFDDADADFIHSLAGIHLFLNDDLDRLWPIVDHPHHGQSLDLDAGTLAFTGQPGDVYGGLYLFDRVTVRGSARVATFDLVTALAEDVEPGSDWQILYAPTAALTSPADGDVFVEGDLVTLAADVDSVFGIAVVRLGLGGDVAEIDEPPFTRNAVTPEVAFPTETPVTLEVVDGSGRVLRDERSVTIVNPPASIALQKSGALDLGADGSSTAGDVISYSFEITNDGGETLSSVTVDDPLVAAISCPSGAPGTPDVIPALAPGEVETCTGSYAITQSDIDAGVRDNTATVTGEDPLGNPVSAVDGHSEVIPDPSGGPAAFACTGDAYLVQNQDAELTLIDVSSSPFTFVTIGGATGTELNNLGFRSTDGLLYAVELSSGGNIQIVQIDATGTLNGLGRPAGLPTGPRFDAGDVSPDGSTMYITSNNQPLYRLDLTSVPSLPAVTSVSVSGATGFVFDWAVNPADGKLYGGDSSQGQVAILDPATGVRSDVSVSGLPSGAGYGGAWFGDSGHLFLYQNDGHLYEIDLAGPTVVDTQTGPSATRNDGAACVELAPPPASIALEKSGALDLGADGESSAGDVISYSFEITNDGGETLTAVTVDDPLVAAISCPSGAPGTPDVIPALAPGAVETCTGSYAITQSDVDAGVRENTATVTGEDAAGSPVSAVDSHSEVIPDPSGGPASFGCTGDAYLVQNQDAELTRLDVSTSPFTFVTLGGATGTELNNLGFRSTDGLLYAVELSSGGNLQIVQIDATGTVYGLGRPAGLPSGPRFDAGDVSPDGSTMYITTNNQPLYRLDLTSVPNLPAVTSVSVSGATGFVFDWAVSPADGRLYGGDSSQGQLAILDPATGARSDVSVSGLPSGAGYGGAWFGDSGHLFLYQNDGHLYEIDLAGPTVVDTQTGPSATRNDGAACAAPQAEPPTVDIGCPSAGALLAPSTGLDVTVEASSEEGVDKVEFFLGAAATPDGADSVPPYTYRLEAPATAVDGEVLTLRAVATSLGGLTAEATVDVRVVVGWVVDGDAVLAAGDPSQDGAAVVVASGTLTLEGSHAFRDLAVLDGATVTHPPAPAPAEIPQTGLVAEWSFDEPSDPAAGDFPAQLGSAAGTDANDPLYECDPSAIARLAGNHCALDFSGEFDSTQDDFVAVAGDPALDFTAAFTLSGWMRIDGGAERHVPIFIRGAADGSDANDVEVYVQHGTHDLVVAVNRGNGGSFDFAGFEDPPAGTLFHLAVTFDGSTLAVYYDGVVKAVTQNDAAVPPPLASGLGWLLGKVDHQQFDSGDGRWVFFDGLIDEVRFYDRALAIEEIASLAAATRVIAEENLLEVHLTGDLYVACGGAVDVSGLGYRADAGYPNTSAERAAAGVGGSHGGRGGHFAEAELTDPALPGRVYGSLFDPRDPGAGGGSLEGVADSASAGGGVIRIATPGNLVIDGALRAGGGGDGSAAAHGAGGSIRLDAQTLAGRGTIDASGAGSASSEPGGGGGRVAIYAGTLDAGLLARTTAAGGDSVDPAARGSAGTVYVLRDGDVFGELVVDGGAVASTQVTELLAVGTGTLTAATATGFSSDGADFVYNLAGVQVVINGDLGQGWPVLGHTHHGQSLEVDTSQLAFAAQAGDAYQGRYRFDLVTVRSAQVITVDLLAASAEDVDPGSLLEAGYQPLAELTTPAEGTSFDSGDTITITAQAATAYGIAAVRIGFDGDFVDVDAEPLTRVVTAPAVSEPTDFVVALEVVDRSGRLARSSVTVTVTPAAPSLTVEVAGRVEAGRRMPPGILRKDETEE